MEQLLSLLEQEAAQYIKQLAQYFEFFYKFALKVKTSSLSLHCSFGLIHSNTCPEDWRLSYISVDSRRITSNWNRPPYLIVILERFDRNVVFKCRSPLSRTSAMLIRSIVFKMLIVQYVIRIRKKSVCEEVEATSTFKWHDFQRNNQLSRKSIVLKRE